MGAYAALSPTGMDTDTSSVMFVFNTGEIWCVDTTVLQISGKGNLYFLDIARSLVQRLPGCAELLKCLGTEPPFDWIAGLDGIEGWRLNVPPPPNHINPFPGQTSLSSIAVAKGIFELGQVPSLALRPFFAEIFKKCGTTIPAQYRRGHPRQSKILIGTVRRPLLPAPAIFPCGRDMLPLARTLRLPHLPRCTENTCIRLNSTGR